LKSINYPDGIDVAMTMSERLAVGRNIDILPIDKSAKGLRLIKRLRLRK
jgi:hypothetical protein